MNKKITLSIIYALFTLWVFEATLLAFNVGWAEIALLCVSSFSPVYLCLHYIPNKSKLLILSFLRGIIMGAIPHLIFWSVTLSFDSLIFTDFVENRFAVLSLSLVTFIFLTPFVLLPAFIVSFFYDYSFLVFDKINKIKFFKL